MKQTIVSQFDRKVFVPDMESVLNMDTPNNFKSNKFSRPMALCVREEKQLKG